MKVKSLSRVQLLATPWTAVLVLKKLDLLDGFQQSLLKGKVRRVPGYVIDSCTFLWLMVRVSQGLTLSIPRFL